MGPKSGQNDGLYVGEQHSLASIATVRPESVVFAAILQDGCCSLAHFVVLRTGIIHFADLRKTNGNQ